MHFLRGGGGGGGGANIDNMKNTKKITYFCLKMKSAISFILTRHYHFPH